MQKVARERFVIAGHPYELTSDDVERAANDLRPESLRDHYVVVRSHRYPPKQILEATTGIDRADFTTHQARSILRRLGFPIDRLKGNVGESAPAYARKGIDPAIEEFRDAERRMWDEELVQHLGRWAIIKDFHVLYSHEDPSIALRWAIDHKADADEMFRIGRPGDPIYGIDDKFMD